MRHSLTAATAALALLAGCSGTESAPPAVVPAPAAPSPTPSADAVDQYGQRACVLVAEAIAADNLTEDGVVAEIAKAGAKSTNASVADAAGSLPERLELALAAKGQDDEFVMDINLTTAATEMQNECVRGRLN